MGYREDSGLTIPSIVRRAQYENLKAVLGRIQDEENFITRWLAIEEKNIKRKRKKYREVVPLEHDQKEDMKLSA